MFHPHLYLSLASACFERRSYKWCSLKLYMYVASLSNISLRIWKLHLASPYKFQNIAPAPVRCLLTSSWVGEFSDSRKIRISEQEQMLQMLHMFHMYFLRAEIINYRLGLLNLNWPWMIVRKLFSRVKHEWFIDSLANTSVNDAWKITQFPFPLTIRIKFTFLENSIFKMEIYKLQKK